MRSLKLEGHSSVSVVDVPEPVPAPGQVVVKTGVSVLCGSELHGFRGDGVAQGNSGHEAMGKVLRVGDGVTRVKVGQRVGVSAIAGCGQPECEACRHGQSTWCPKFRFHASMHAEQFLAYETACLPLPDDVPDQVAVLISGDGLGVPYHTGLKLTDASIRSIAVFGLGPIGLGHVLLQAYYKRTIIAIDRSPERLALARQFGATHVIDVKKQDVVQTVKTLTGGKGVDVAIEAAGVPQTAKQCFRVVRTDGLVVFNGEQPAVELSPSEDFIRRDIRALGSWFFHVGEFPGMLKLYRAGFAVDHLITHVFPLSQAKAAYDAFAAATTGKVMLTYNAP